MKKSNENIKLIIGIIVAIIISSMISIKAATTLASSSVYYDTSKSGGSSSNVNGAIDELYSLTTDREKLKAEILDLTWPVGSVYISTTDSSVEKVQERFGGTWVKYAEDMTLVGASSTKAVNSTGGLSSTLINTKNLPTFSISGNTNNTGSGYKFGYKSSTRTTSTNGNHKHKLTISWPNSQYGTNSASIAKYSQDPYSATYDSETTGNHSHTVADTMLIV